MGGLEVEHLVFGAPLWSVELAISVLGLVVGSVIAIAGSLIAYRSNNGTEPLLFIGSHGLKGGGGNKELYWALLEVDFWNNRKYPIRYSGITVRFPNIEIVDSAFDKETGWGSSNQLVYWRAGPTKIGPSAHMTHNVEIPFKRRSLDDLRSTVVVTASFFDPVKNRTIEKQLSHVYSFDS